MKHKLLVLGTIFLMAGCSNQPASIDSQVDELYAQMSMEERVAQLRSGFMDDLFDEAGRLDKLTIENLTISRKMTEEEKAEIQKRFPKAVINNR